MICERSRDPGAWQFPQGGIDPGETALEAVHREVCEEVGFLPSQYSIEESRGGYRYDYPPGGARLRPEEEGPAFRGAGTGVFPVPPARRTLRNPRWITGSFAPSDG